MLTFEPLESPRGLAHIPGIYSRMLPEAPDLWAAKLKDDLATQLVRRAGFPFRQELTETLLHQYAGIGHPKVLENIRLLTNPDTFTVTTGHQLCLFGGPLFFTYKILSVIRLAETLSAQMPGKKVVPVFWMATEDHDFEEIRHTVLFGKNLSWESEQRGAVGRFTTEGLAVLLEEMETLKGTLPAANELLTLFREAYTGSQTLAEATRKLADGLFGRYGLVCIDGDAPELKRLFLPQLREELFEQPVFRIVQQTNSRLESEGFEPQVNPRELNLFYLQTGLRTRMVKDGTHWTTADTPELRWTADSLMQELEAHPERFSPNVLLRPLYQETVLPNLAYIGGPGEVAYWMQLPGVFEHFSQAFPVLIPRHSALILEAPVREKIARFGFSEEELFQPVEDLVQQYIHREAGDEITLSAEKEELSIWFEKLAERVGRTDASLKPTVGAEAQKANKFLENLEGRLRKVEKQKHENALNQIRAVKEKLFPGGIPQERHDTLIPYYWKYGAGFIDEVLVAFEPFDLRYRFLNPA